MRKRKPTVFLLTLVLAMLMMPLTAAYADTGLDTELVTNGGAESANISGWTDNTGQGRWSSSTAYSNWASPSAGSYYFFLYNPSMDTPLSGTMSQEIALSGTEGSGLFSAISAGNVSIRFSISMFQGISADNEAKVILEEYAADGSLLKTSQVVNTTSSGTAMGPYQINTQVNPGTRKFKVILSAALTRGGYAQFDQVSLKLVEASAGSAPVFGSNFPTSAETDAGVPYTVNFTISDADPGDLDRLTFSASSTNVNLVPAANITVSGSGGSRTLRVAPTGNLSGEADITVIASDGTKSAEKTFHFIVHKVISMDTNLVENGNGSSGLAGWSGNTVNITATGSGFRTNDPGGSMNQNIDISKFSPLIDGGETEFLMSATFPNGYGKVNAQFYTDIACTNPVGSSFEVKNTAASLQQKVPVNTKGVKITFSNTHWDYIDIEVRNISFQIVNNFPKISSISARATDLSPLTVPVYAYYTTANATLTASSSDQTIVPNGGISAGGSGFNRSISFTPLKNGNVTITLTLNDGSGSVSTSFDVTVHEPAKVINIASPAPGFYGEGGNLDFTVQFNYPVTGGTGSKLPLTIGGASAVASYLSGTADIITYRYTIGSGDSGTVEIGTAIDDTSSPITDEAGYDAEMGISTGATGVAAVQAPQVASTAVGGSATYGTRITFTATLNCAEPLSGTVQFKANGTGLGSPADVSGNTASYETAETTLDAETLSITAEFVPSGSNVYFTSLTSSAYTVTINQKPISVDGFTAPAKTYDGTTSVPLSGGTLAGVLVGDDVSAVYPAAGTVVQKDVSTQNVIFAPIELTGADKDNYVLSSQPDISVVILPKPVTALVNIGSKVYDGNTNAAVSFSFASGTIYPGDVVNVSAAGTFDSKDAGDGKPVTLSGVTKSGTDADNYDISMPSGLSADITRLGIEITPEPATKICGTSDPVFDYRITSGTLIASESLAGSLSRAAGEAVGEYAITQGTVTNENNPNYDIVFIAGAKLTVTPAPIIDATISPDTGSFDRNTANQADVQTEITWGSATGVTDVKTGAISIGAGNYSVSDDTLTIKKEYLAAQSTGSLVLTISFNQGAAATLIIAVTNTAPPSISPMSGNYDLNAPDVVTTNIEWNRAESVTSVVYGSAPLTPPDAYTINDSVLTITNSYLSGLLPTAGNILDFDINFNTGDTATLTVHVVNGYVPSDNADLRSLSVNGIPVSGFDPDVTAYNVELPYGASSAVVTATASDPNAECIVTPASSLPGSATITVTAEDGTTTKTYTINFTIGPPFTVPVTEITVTGTGGAESVQSGNTLQMLAAVSPVNATNKNVTWSISGSGATISASGLLTATAAASVTVRATADDGSGVYGEKVITVTATPVTTYTVTATAGSGGSISPSGAVSVAESGSQTFNITPGAGYRISSVTVDGVGQGAVTSYTFTNVTANHTINATFTRTGGEGENDGDSAPSTTSTPSTPSTPTYNADVKAENGTETTLPVAVNGDNGTASIDAGSQSFAQGATVIMISPIPGVDTYSVGIPVPELSTSDGQGTLTLRTDAGSVTVTSDMLTGVSGIIGSKAEITIGQGDKDNLPDDVKAAIGDKPLIRLTLSIDGKQAGWNNPDAPVTVSIPYMPTAAELADPESIVVWYIDGSGDVVTIPNGRYNPETGMVTFDTTHFSDYAVAYNKVSFSDVAAGAWYNKAVSFIAARGIADGGGNGKYSPDAKLTRGEFIVMMMRAYEIAPDTNPADNFADSGSTYYTGYLAAAKRLGISEGVGNNLYAPGKELTRQDMFTLLYNALKVIGRLPQGNCGQTLSDFTDASQIDEWAREAVTAFVATGTAGSGNSARLNPLGKATRAEMAQVLYNLLWK